MFTNLIEIQQLLKSWWEFGEQSKPLLLIRVLNEDRSLSTCCDNLQQYWTDIDSVMARSVELIEKANYHGVAVPFHYIDFGASAMACSLGGRIEYLNKDTVWAHPVVDRIEDILERSLSETNIAYYTQMELTRRSVAIANNHHFVSPWALGGILDTISSLYGTEKLLLDLSENVDAVEHVITYLTQLWVDEFKKNIKFIENSGNSGHVCCWVGIWAPGSTFPIQEDFAYMISPEMFRRFCLPSIKKMVDVMDYPLFHLDGIGMLNHLDALLEIEKLKAIQWQPGAGKERLDQWYPIIHKILNAGKSCQVFADPDEIRDLVNHVGTQGLLIIVKNATNADAQNLINTSHKLL